MVHDFSELAARSAEVRGNIVLFEVRFDQRLADNGEAATAYGQAGEYRFVGPSEAAALGAAARAGTLDRRCRFTACPHRGERTGRRADAHPRVPHLRRKMPISSIRLAAAGPVTMKLMLTPQTLPDADSDNVIADWPGREKPDEYVVVSGHLDSWDLGTGATDDGVGMIAAAAVIEIMKQLDLHPRRTIRFIAWTNEENGGPRQQGVLRLGQGNDRPSDRGNRKRRGRRTIARHSFACGQREFTRVAAIRVQALTPIGATALSAREGEVGADIAPLQEAGTSRASPPWSMRGTTSTITTRRGHAR